MLVFQKKKKYFNTLGKPETATNKCRSFSSVWLQFISIFMPTIFLPISRNVQLNSTYQHLRVFFLKSVNKVLKSFFFLWREPALRYRYNFTVLPDEKKKPRTRLSTKERPLTDSVENLWSSAYTAFSEKRFVFAGLPRWEGRVECFYEKKKKTRAQRAIHLAPAPGPTARTKNALRPLWLIL